MSYNKQSLDLFLRLHEALKELQEETYNVITIAESIRLHGPNISKLNSFLLHLSEDTSLEKVNSLWEEFGYKKALLTNEDLYFFIDGFTALKRDGVSKNYSKLLDDLTMEALTYFREYGGLGIYSLYFTSTINNNIRKIPMLFYQGANCELKVKLSNKHDPYQYYGFALLIYRSTINISLIEKNQKNQELSNLKFIVPFGKPLFYEGVYQFLNPDRIPSCGPCVLVKEEIENTNNIFEYFDGIKSQSLSISDENINIKIRDFFKVNEKFVLRTGFNR